MAKNHQEKIIYGFSNIHVAKFNEETKVYETPEAILGAKSVEVSFDTTDKKVSADDKVVWQSMIVTSGSGTLEVLGLTTDEKALLFGTVNMSGGFAMGANTSMPKFALLFEQQKADGKKILHALYNVTFSPSGINCTSLEEGEIEESTESLEFVSMLGENGYYFYSLDTADAKADSVLVDGWFTEVQNPKPTTQA